MRWAMVPLAAVAAAGRMDAEFFLEHGGVRRKLERAARLEELARAHLRNAARLRVEAEVDQTAAAAFGIVVHER